MSSFVVIIGEGWLADRVAEELSSRHQVFRRTDFENGLPENSELMLVLHDCWNPIAHQKAEEAAKLTGSPWLRAYAAFGEGVMGPLVRPGTSGCSQCADLRILLGGQERNEMLGVKQKLRTVKEISPDPWASKNGLLQLVHLIVTEADKVLAGKESHSAGRMYFTDLKTLNGSWHSFLADSLCQVCSSIPADSASIAEISLNPSLKISAGSYRCTPLHKMKEVLIADYYDNRTGLLNSKMYDLVTPFADASVNLPMISGGNEGTAGRTQCYAESELTAILEGLERHCGLQPRGKRSVIHDTYWNLEKQALNPLEVGVHADEEYEKPGFPFQKFDPDMPMDWVWGYSLIEERPILVPELLSYYSLGCGSAGFVYETSNGCALGGSREEAIFYGIMEVVERDSFLLSWYSRLKLPRLDLQTAEDEELLLMAERMKAVAGYDLYLFNSTMEHGIPSVWAMAKNRKDTGLNIICAAGAHLDPVKAAKSAVQELAGMMLNLDGKLEGNKEKYLEMLEDDSLVREMDDHGMLFGLPQAEKRLAFLLEDNRPLQSFQDAFQKESRHADLTEDLRDILQEFRQLGLNVIVVDQTPPELSKNELYCVKVLIPGMLPMTFGHHLTRLKGLDRVLHVPMKLGYVEEPLSFEELNTFPHPFP